MMSDAGGLPGAAIWTPRHAISIRWWKGREGAPLNHGRAVIFCHFQAHLFLGALDPFAAVQSLQHLLGRECDYDTNSDNRDLCQELTQVMNWLGLVDFHTNSLQHPGAC